MHNFWVFYYYFQKSLFAENYFLIAVTNLTTRGPLHTCLALFKDHFWQKIIFLFLQYTLYTCLFVVDLQQSLGITFSPKTFTTQILSFSIIKYHQEGEYWCSAFNFLIPTKCFKSISEAAQSTVNDRSICFVCNKRGMREVNHTSPIRDHLIISYKISSPMSCHQSLKLIPFPFPLWPCRGQGDFLI